MVVCADLLRNGFEVYKAVNPNAACDLLVMRGDTVERIEVKLMDVDGYGYPKGDLGAKCGRFDRLAMVTSKGAIVYKTHAEAYRPPKQKEVG